MSATTPALLAAAAGVGFGHAILPDHWVPLAVVGRTRRYPLARVARLSGMAGVAHVLVSIVLGGVIIAVGLQFRSTVQSAQDTIIGCVLILTGLGFAALELTGHGHHHGHDHAHTHGHGHTHGHNHAHTSHDHGHTHGHDQAHPHEHPHLLSAPEVDEQIAVEESRFHGLASVMVPFGAAASPDLTILPVFLAATTAGVSTAIGSLVIFAAVTIGTIVSLTLLACFGGYQVRGQWLERWGNVFTALVLIVIGALVLTGAI
jgi:ABC-type nickel/cobalt efflux system permease component RcnA